jgi:hypothetical protein
MHACMLSDLQKKHHFTFSVCRRSRLEERRTRLEMTPAAAGKRKQIMVRNLRRPTGFRRDCSWKRSRTDEGHENGSIGGDVATTDEGRTAGASAGGTAFRQSTSAWRRRSLVFMCESSRSHDSALQVYRNIVARSGVDTEEFAVSAMLIRRDPIT